jgi:hypothetical protein
VDIDGDHLTGHEVLVGVSVAETPQGVPIADITPAGIQSHHCGL